MLFSHGLINNVRASGEVDDGDLVQGLVAP